MAAISMRRKLAIHSATQIGSGSGRIDEREPLAVR
jgi:hypothetical protein